MLPSREKVDTLSRLLSELASRSSSERMQAAESIKKLVEAKARTNSREVFDNFMDDLTPKIANTMLVGDILEKSGGILAIEALLDVESATHSSRLTRYNNFLWNLLPNSNYGLVRLTARALGKVAQVGGALSSELVEYEAKRCVEWLKTERQKDADKRFAAVCVLKELAEKAHTFLYGHLSSFGSLFWNALQDGNLEVREAAQLTLRSFLIMFGEREGSGADILYNELYEEASKRLEGRRSDPAHGAVLVLGELLRCAGRHVEERYRDLGGKVLSLKDHKSHHIRRSVVQLVPELARYSPRVFVEQFSSEAIQFLLSMVKKEPDRALAFEAIGELALAVRKGIEPSVHRIMVAVREHMTGKKSYPEEILKCIAALAKALGPQCMVDQISGVLDNMFQTGLTPVLTESLSQLCETIPALHRPIQERLLEMLSRILARSPYHIAVSGDRPDPTYSMEMFSITIETPTTPTIRLALETLGSFDFRGYSLLDFVRQSVLRYLEDDDADVRVAAAMTCAKIIRGREEKKRGSVRFSSVRAEVLERLLLSAIGDPNPQIRKTILQSMHPEFDSFLALSENLRSLFMALHDEVFENRLEAVTILGRLSTRNPAYVLPSFRRSLLQLLSQLRYSEDSRQREESALMLGHLINVCPRLVKPYVSVILKILQKTLSDSSPVVVTAALSAVGFLAVVGGTSMSEHVDDLIVRVMKMMQEQSVTNMREVALRTLRLLVSSTGKVIDPYYKHPDLLPLLLGMIRAEDSISTRLEAIRVVGTLGAVDPYRCSLMGEKESRDNRDDYFPVIDASVVTEDYYSTVAIRALLRILKDTSLSNYHRRVVECIIQIFRVLGLKVVHFLPEIIPPFLDLVRQFSDIGMRAWVIKNLSEFVNCVKLHIRNYLDDIFALIKECWCKELISHIVHLILAIAKALRDEFRRYLPDLLPNILSVFWGSTTNPDDNPIFVVLEALQQFGRILEDYLYLVLPPVLRLIEDEDALPSLRCAAAQMIGRLSRSLNLSEYSSSIIHPICRVLVSERSPDSLKIDGIQVLSLMVHQLSSEFAIFTPTVNKVLRQIKSIDTTKLEELMNIVLSGSELPELDEEADGFAVGGIQGHDAPVGTQDDGKLSVVVASVFQACVVQPRMTKDDWVEWLRRFALELLRQSPSKALRSCWGLGQNYPPLSRELFNASFLSFWTVLKNEEERKDIIESLKIVFGYFEQHPTDVLQTLLNVIEFTEHANLNLRDELERGSLGALSMHCKAHAKALRYKEMEFLENPSPEVIERLITINDMLQHHEAASGILVHAQRHHAVQVKESWLERLQKWDEALEAYERKHEENPLNVEVLFGRMRCMQSLGEWENLFRLCFDSWKVLEPEKRKRMAPMGASCAWVLQEWDFLEDCVNVMPEEEGYLYQAVLSTHNHDFVGALKFIDLSRRIIDAELTAVLPESYFRAYPLLVKAQQLTELEEVIDFIRLPESDPERATQYRDMWDKRIKQVQRRYHHWQDLLNVRRLVVEPQRDIDMWLKFAKLCEMEGSSSLSFRQLRMLLGDNDFVRDPDMLLRACGLAEDADDFHEFPDFGEDNDRTVWVVVSCIEHLYNIGQHECALDLMKKVVVLAQDIDEHLAARCFLKAGKWDVSLHEQPSDEVVLRAMECFRQSTVQDPEWSKGWHSWATMNVEMINRSIPQSLEELYADNTGNLLSGFDEVEKERISTYVQAAVKGFFKSILCGHSKGGTVQDTLRLLTLWFAFGETENVYEELEKGFLDVQVLVWLEVIPQIMARVHMQGRIHALILKLLRQVGDDHPQALIYPLTVASRSAILSRRQAAEHVLNHIREQEDLLVDHAAMVSNELIRVAVLWAEQWYEGLETASRLYFGEHDINGMLACMQKLHDMLEETQTTDERNFVQIFGSDLQRTREWLQRFKRTRNEGDLSQAWDGYFNAYRRLQKEIMKISLLELQKVSAGLHTCQDLELGMPGMYNPLKKEVKKIKKFHPILHVIPSKQRPRKITLVASDDKEYMYLLKGREDLRQDERVMQIFGLVNTLLATARDTSNRNLLIDPMPVVPLREDAGLISWLSECDTFHSLIQEHRASSSIKMGLEHDLLVHLSADYDTLPPTHKVELFEEGLSGIIGDDLYRVLWLRSSSSEVWLERRTNYTRSLALMSMVGYVLGLGDRHPSNLMLNRYTGKVSHIDFGDCFEVAQQREKYPEKVPFRLTRMLVMAMEVSGIEGTYRSTCNAVMSVLRRHRDSLMAMLEAFVHDPLINWRLLESHELSPVALDGEPPKKVAEPLGPHDIPADKYREMYSKSSSPTRGLSAEEGASEESHHGNINEKAVCVVQRIRDKLTGMDFVGSEALPVVDQVERLIQQATSPKNLCQCYVGWCPFW